MAEVSPLPFEVQLFDNNGVPLSGGLVFTYQVGTLVPLTTYQDINGLIPNSNPIVANAAGRLFCWASGDVRLIVQNSNGVLIADYNSTAPLRSDVISDAMLPVVGAPTLAIARTRLGIDAEIAAAIAAVDLLPGPAGPAGPQGSQGNAGPTGASSSYVPTVAPGNPATIAFPNLNGSSASVLFQCGQSTTASNGLATVTYPTPFPSGVLALLVSTQAEKFWIAYGLNGNTGFTAESSSPLVGGSWIGGPCPFSWLAIGY